MLRLTPLEAIPPYLKAVTILRPEGNIAAEVASALRGWVSAELEGGRRKARVPRARSIIRIATPGPGSLCEHHEPL